MPYRHKTDYGYENFDRKTVNSDGTTFWGMDQAGWNNGVVQ